MPVDKTISKAQTEFEKNRKWRAKEIIASSMKQYDYDADLFSFYGEILLSMEDNLQAGKYLFFSKDSLNQQEKEAVKLFIDRHFKEEYESLSRHFPAKDYSYHLLPNYVKLRLKEYGAEDDLFEDGQRFQEIKDFKYSTDDNGSSCFFWAIFIITIMLTLFIVGIVTSVTWLIQLF